MNTLTLFVSTVLIWGTTWIAIAWQVGDVPIIVSIFYRFALAGGVMVLGLAALGRLHRPAQWRFVVVQALCLFSFNFVGFYQATLLMPSGLVSVVFSLASIFNAVNARVFFGERIAARVIGAGCVGALGLGLLFWNDVVAAADRDTVLGIAWAAFGTMMFSFGNMASRKNGALGVSPVTANAWGMGIGAAVLLVLALVSGQPIILPNDIRYLSALVYLAVIGSVVGFTTYLLLVQKIGSAKAGYATVVFPLVALVLSTVFEGFVWSWTAGAGVVLILCGNVLMFARR